MQNKPVNIGTVQFVQVQREPLKIGSGSRRVYDPAPLERVPELRLTSEGVEGVGADGTRVLDTHHKNHPRSRFGGWNAISMGLTAHYEKMRARFGSHITDGIAGENIIVTTRTAFEEDALQGILVFENPDGTTCRMRLNQSMPPCTEFSHFANQAEDQLPAAVLKETLQFLNAGRRGFTLFLADGDSGRVLPGARVRLYPVVSTKLLVIGGVTIDKIHLPGQAEPVVAPGGAGLFTAFGSLGAGGRVTLFAQRPEPMPEILAPIDREIDWQGPVIPPDDLPRLEIAHHGNDRAELVSAEWGAQLRLGPDELPVALITGALCHVAAMGPTENQIRFAKACLERGARAISAGTYGRAAHGETDRVRELAGLADYFFMNENEACGLFGSLEAVEARPGQVIFVTLGTRGALAITAEQRLHRPASAVEASNPTGAGDVFCGAALALLARGGTIAEALTSGVVLAAEQVRG